MSGAYAVPSEPVALVCRNEACADFGAVWLVAMERDRYGRYPIDDTNTVCDTCGTEGSEED